MRRPFAALVAVTALAVPFAGTADAIDVVDLETSLLEVFDRPVPEAPAVITALVRNIGTATATGTRVEVPVPDGAEVVGLSEEACSLAAELVTCSFPELRPEEALSGRIYLTFGATGTYPMTASAAADQADADGSSDSKLDLVVEPEHADLEGESASTRIVLGSVPTTSVFHVFRNRGPTAAGGATVTGTVTGGATIDAESFTFRRDFFEPRGEVAEDHCTVSATAFTCTDLFSPGTSHSAVQPYVEFAITIPEALATVVASATITGQGDPDHSNDTSTHTIEVDEPKAELLADLLTTSLLIPANEPYNVRTSIVNTGEITAQDLVAVLDVPTGWGLVLGPDPLPPGVECGLVPTLQALRCTREALVADDWWTVEAMVTPPAGRGSGQVTFAVTTTTPEIGTFPNDATATLRYAPTRTLEVEPSTDLEPGDVVTVRGSGFTPGATVFFCQEQRFGESSPGGCGRPYQSRTADRDGSFTATMTVDRYVVPSDAGVVDCARPGPVCSIAAGDIFEPEGAIATSAITLTPLAPVDDPLDARIIGRVVDEEGDPVAGALVWAYRRGDYWIGSLRTTTDASGAFLLEEAEPGFRYRIRVGAPGTGFVTEWYGGPGSDGAQSWKDADLVRLDSVQPVVDLEVELSVGGTLTGTVEGPDGQPLTGARVQAYREQDHWAGTYATVTGDDGSYRIESVEAGIDLRIRFEPERGSGLAPEWFDDAERRRDGTVVHVGAGGTTEAHAELADGS